MQCFLLFLLLIVTLSCSPYSPLGISRDVGECRSAVRQPCLVGNRIRMTMMLSRNTVILQRQTSRCQ